MSVLVAYLVQNLVTGKRYVGVTSRSIKARWAEHLRAARGAHGTRLYTLHKAIQARGEAAFRCEAIACALSWDDIYAVEVALIAQHNSSRDGGWGYNVTDGGPGAPGLRHPEEERERRRIRALGRKHTPETCARMSAAKKGKPVPYERIAAMLAYHVGRPRTAETKEKLRLAHTGRTISEETKAKMSAAAKLRTGRSMSPETRAKIAAAHTGRKASEASRARMRAKTFSPEQRAKMAASARVKVFTIEHRQAIGEASRLAWARRSAAA